MYPLFRIHTYVVRTIPKVDLETLHRVLCYGMKQLCCLLGLFAQIHRSRTLLSSSCASSRALGGYFTWRLIFEGTRTETDVDRILRPERSKSGVVCRVWSRTALDEEA